MQSSCDVIITLEMPLIDRESHIFVSVIILPLGVALDGANLSMAIILERIVAVRIKFRSLVNIVINACVITCKELHDGSSFPLSRGHKFPPLRHILNSLTILHDWDRFGFILSLILLCNFLWFRFLLRFFFLRCSLRIHLQSATLVLNELNLVNRTLLSIVCAN
jgi:hypothetical protein